MSLSEERSSVSDRQCVVSLLTKGKLSLSPPLCPVVWLHPKESVGERCERGNSYSYNKNSILYICCWRAGCICIIWAQQARSSLATPICALPENDTTTTHYSTWLRSTHHCMHHSSRIATTTTHYARAPPAVRGGEE